MKRKIKDFGAFSATKVKEDNGKYIIQAFGHFMPEMTIISPVMVPVIGFDGSLYNPLGLRFCQLYAYDGIIGKYRLSRGGKPVFEATLPEDGTHVLVNDWRKILDAKKLIYANEYGWQIYPIEHDRIFEKLKSEVRAQTEAVEVSVKAKEKASPFFPVGEKGEFGVRVNNFWRSYASEEAVNDSLREAYENAKRGAFQKYVKEVEPHLLRLRERAGSFGLCLDTSGARFMLHNIPNMSYSEAMSCDLSAYKTVFTDTVEELQAKIAELELNGTGPQ